MSSCVDFLSLNEFFKKHFGQRVQKIPLDAGLGCPNRISGKGGCIYCNENGSGTGAFSRGVSIKEQLVAGMKWAKKRYKAKRFAAYFQSFSNTYAPVEKLEEIYKEVADFPDVVAVAIGTRPDCVSREVLDLIHSIFEGKMVWMEYGLQSASDRTLELIRRGHKVSDFVNAVRLTKEYPFYVCAHVIFGLPGEGERQMLETVELLRDTGVHGVKFHQLYVVKGTPLCDMFEKGLYQPISQEFYAKVVAKAIRLLPSSTVIQRLTGDPAPGELVAPDWAARKQETISLIRYYLKES